MHHAYAIRLMMQHAPAQAVLNAIQAQDDWFSLAAQEELACAFVQTNGMRLNSSLKAGQNAACSAAQAGDDDEFNSRGHENEDASGGAAPEEQNGGRITARNSSESMLCIQDMSYVRRVLKLLLRELDGHEVHEELLKVYLRALDVDSEAAQYGAAGAFTALSFELRNGKLVTVRASQNAIGGGMETGGMIWPAGLVLAAWVEQHAHMLNGAHVVELGAGVGLPGIVAAACAPEVSVTLTDHVAATLDNLRGNVALLPPDDAKRVRVHSLDWTEVAALLRDPLAPNDESRRHEDLRGDLILGSDLVYDLSVLPALAATLAWLLRPHGGESAKKPPAEHGASVASCSTSCQPLSAVEVPQQEHKEGGSQYFLAGQASGCAFESRVASRPIALIVSEKRSDETWQAFETLLDSHGLSARSLSDDAHELICPASDQGSECPFHVDPNALKRVLLIEVCAKLCGSAE